MWIDVDTAVTVPVNVLPLLDDTTFKDIEEAVAYNAAGMDLNWNFLTSAGVQTQTNVTPTTSGLHDWTHVGNGMYKIEIPDTGGTINNDTEGYGWFTGVATGVLPWCGPRIGFRAAPLNDALCDGGDLLDVSLTQIGGVAQSATDLKDFADTGYDPSTHRARANLEEILGHLLTQTGTQLADGFQHYFDVATPAITVADAMVGTDSALTTKTGFTLTNLSDANAGKLEDMLDGTGAVLTLSQLRVNSAAAGGAVDIDNSNGVGIAVNGSTYDIDADIHGTIDTVTTCTTTTTNTDMVGTNSAATAAKLEAYVQLLARSDDAITTDRATELAEINANEGSGAGNYAATTDSQEGIRDRGDSAWVTATSVAVSDKTGFKLASDGLDLVTAWTVNITGTVNGNSTHNAAAVVTAMETDGSKLDHLWETTEDDGGVRRFTTNALEQAPTGGTAPTVGEIRTEMETDGGKLDHLWEMTEDDGGVRRLTTNALEQGPTGSGATAQQVWEYGTRTLSAFSFTVTTDTASRTASKADVSGLATSVELAAVQTHGDTTWKTAVNFSTHDAAAVAALILVTPANKLATDASGYVTYANTAPPTALAIASQVDTTLSGTHGSGSWEGGAAAPTVQQIREEMDSNSTQLIAIVADTNELQVDWADGGRLDSLLDSCYTGTPPTANSIAVATLDLTDGIETGKTLRQAIRIIGAVTGGKISGAGTGTEVCVGLNGVDNRVVAIVDSKGNRTNVSYP